MVSWWLREEQFSYLSESLIRLGAGLRNSGRTRVSHMTSSRQCAILLSTTSVSFHLLSCTHFNSDLSLWQRYISFFSQLSLPTSAVKLCVSLWTWRRLALVTMQIYDQAPMSSRLSINVAPQAPAPRVISPLCDYSPRDSDFTTSSFTSTPYRSNIVVALDRVASIFRSTSPISETKFIIACKKIITLLRSPDSRDITPSQQVMVCPRSALHAHLINLIAVPHTLVIQLAYWCRWGIGVFLFFCIVLRLTQNAVITFVVRLFPSVIDTITASTSLNLPVSPMIMISLLKVVDAHIIESGDFSTQRTSSIYS